jgi:hypothetical protein
VESPSLSRDVYRISTQIGRLSTAVVDGAGKPAAPGGRHRTGEDLMTTTGSPIASATHRRLRSRRAAALGAALALAATFAPIATAPSSARTFDVNAHGTLVQNPLPADWNCLWQRAIANHRIACR